MYSSKKEFTERNASLAFSKTFALFRSMPEFSDFPAVQKNSGSGFTSG
jgi:hypothetical protein